LQDVIDAVAKASKNTSPLPKILEKAKKDDKTTIEGQTQIRDDDLLAAQLAELILASKTAKDVAAAFSKIVMDFKSAGVEDAEELIQIELDGQAEQAVMNASLALGDIKSVFHKEASEAKSVKEVENAYKKAGNAA
jgi:hypothetical protein